MDCAILSFVKKKASQNVDAVVGISDYILNEHIEKGLFKNAQKKVIFNGFEINETNNKPHIFPNFSNFYNLTDFLTKPLRLLLY